MTESFNTERKTLICILATGAIITIGAAFWLTRAHNLQQPVMSAENKTDESQTTSHDLPKPSEPPRFGKSSLTKSERDILHTPMYTEESLAYEKGVICLKHRLSRKEVLELIEYTDSQTRSSVSYPYGPSRMLVLVFDTNGNFKAAKMGTTEIKLASSEMNKELTNSEQNVSQSVNQ